MLRGARWGLVVFTASINMFLTMTILAMVKVEKSHSKADEEASLFTWVSPPLKLCT